MKGAQKAAAKACWVLLLCVYIDMLVTRSLEGRRPRRGALKNNI